MVEFTLDKLEVGKTYKVTLYSGDEESEHPSFTAVYLGHSDYGLRFQEYTIDHLISPRILLDAEILREG